MGMKPVPKTTKSRVGQDRTVLDSKLPWAQLSLLAAADQRTRDPVYGAHRWWARRPPAVMRGLILAAALPEGTPEVDFWSAFADPSTSLTGISAYDPFAGGGSTLVEARRLGADVAGCDVDPLAVLITNFELSSPTEEDLLTAGAALLAHVAARAENLYPGVQGRPLHYFYLREVTCPDCLHTGPLYRSLIIARDAARTGAVVREAPITAFCPTCFSIHYLSKIDQDKLECCGSRHHLNSGTFTATRYTCPSCNQRWTHTDLRTGVAPRRLIGVEETLEHGRRLIRAPHQVDNDALDRAHCRLAELADELDLPNDNFAGKRLDSRPLSYGVVNPLSLFSDRQQICLGAAFHWINNADISDDVRLALTLTLSNALATNNLLCGYATDYGRLSALFSIRSYSIPALSVELAPLHPEAGRGTLPRSLSRVVRSTTRSVRRHIWSVEEQTPIRVQLDFALEPMPNAISCISAAKASIKPHSIDICITDPPYFDYIFYSELSEFHRLWLNLPLNDEPLLPSFTDGPVKSFATDLGTCLKVTFATLRPGRPLTFTYHATSLEAWEAVGLGLDAAKLAITALWPLRNDAQMGLHSFKGNCEWDVVVVCRSLDDCTRRPHDLRFEDWAAEAARHDLTFSAADEQNVRNALSMASTRFAYYQPTSDEKPLAGMI
jgi:putative DNA methylase